MMIILVICLVLLVVEVLEVIDWQNRQKPRQEITIQTGNSWEMVEERGKQERLERDFIATIRQAHTSKTLEYGSPSTNCLTDNAIAASIRENICLIEKDLIVSDSSLLDELQIEGFLSEEEIKVMKSHSRKDQSHLFAEYISRLDNQAFLSVLSILKSCSFGHIADSLRRAYERNLSALTHVSLCLTCRIKEEVDIKELRCDLLKRDFITSTSSLYSDINRCKKGKGHQKVLWDQLYFHLNKLMQRNNEVIKIFITFFNTPRHRSLYNHLHRKNLSRLTCFCNQTASCIEKDFIKIADAEDTGEESNTQSFPVPIEPEWYRDAVNSSSSDGISATELKTVRKRQCSGDTLNRKGVSRKKLKHTGYVHSSWKMQSDEKHSEEDTSSIDSNPGCNVLKLSKFTPSKFDSTYKITRKRRENSPLKQEISLTVSSNPSESETGVKWTGKKPRICLLSFISDSDFNTDGEPLKTYTFAKRATYQKCGENSPFPNDLKPTAFAKTSISNSESQIW